MRDNKRQKTNQQSFLNDPILAVDPPLDERKKRILKAIIEAYIHRAEPIGSKQLVQASDWDISSATVRKEMAELEDMGYLEQPHTSAGRIPTDKGYRAYVDELLTPVKLSKREEHQLQRFFKERLTEVEELIRAAADALSETTGLTALVLTPRYSDQVLRRLHLLLIEPGRALLVLMLSEGVVKDRPIPVPGMLDGEDLRGLAEALEQSLGGQRIDQITLVMVEQAAGTKPLPDPVVKSVAREVYTALKETEKIDLYMQGQHHLLRQPEFRDPERATVAIDELHKEHGIKTYLSDPMTRDGQTALMVRIGRELALEGLQDLSFVTAVYTTGADMTGQLAVIGPRRMAYGRIISNIQFVRRVLKAPEALEGPAKEEGDEP